MTEEQFTPLAQRYMDTVYRVAYSCLRSPSDADDVTQDVLIQLYHRLARATTPDSAPFRCFLFFSP